MTTTNKERCNMLGALAQAKAQQILEQYGLNVKPTAEHVNDGTQPYDLEARTSSGQRIRIEVKASKLYEAQGKRGRRYQAHIKNHTADVVLFLCIDQEGNDHWFIIPMAEVQPRKQIAVWSQQPAQYRGQWAEYYDKWEGI